MVNHKINLESEMKTYTFMVSVEPDEDRWFAYCPALKDSGAATWGYTREEALHNIQEVVEMIVEEKMEDGEEIPAGPPKEVEIFFDARVAVIV